MERKEIIKIINLKKQYFRNSKTNVALENINLTINEKDIYGIIGHSGSGKSTLVKCINLLEKPTEGKILINNEDITKVSEKRLLEIRKDVAMIFQDFNLLSQRTVLKNVELTGEINNDPNKEEKAKHLLDLVGLSDKLDFYPSQLSGGQCQRVAIARALMSDPKILLCDESTSALDPETTTQILNLLKELNEKLGLTIVIISHQMSVIEAICNKVAIINDSVILESGYIQDVFLKPKTEVAKKLIYSGHINSIYKGEKLMKIMFVDKTDRPIIYEIINKQNIGISILYAESKMLNEKVYGQIIFRLENYKKDIDKLITYLNENKLSYEEVNSDELF